MVVSHLVQRNFDLMQNLYIAQIVKWSLMVTSQNTAENTTLWLPACLLLITI